MDIPANTFPPPPPYEKPAGMQSAVSKDAHVASQQNAGNISVNVTCVPSQPESKPKSESLSEPRYMPQVQAFPQPQMNQVQFQQPQFQPVQVQQPQFQQVQVQQAQFQQPQYVVNQQPIISSGNLGAEPCLTTCTNCRERVTTNVIYKPGALTWVVCLTLILFGFVFGCCLIPFCMDICQDAHHSCPKCHTSLHVHKRL
nr:lipopolysaccharide-induced tumor necrosis factor-alpha factor homolog [Paramormyrops kingsleyae]